MQVVTSLLDQGAEINVKVRQEGSALHAALYFSHK
jgi:ankyrin repeat protein